MKRIIFKKIKICVFKLAHNFIKRDDAAEYGSIFEDNFIPKYEIENTLRTLEILSDKKNKNIRFRTREDLSVENNYKTFDEDVVRKSGKRNPQNLK